jgi:hypothetical protein
LYSAGESVYYHVTQNAVGYFSAIKRNKLFIYTTSWVNLEGSKLSEKSQFQKVIPTV